MQHHFVVVGGGAGGLELACKLGRKFGPKQVTLIDSQLTHIWKPTLHEVAAGTMDLHQEELSYAMVAHDNGFTFVYGAMTALDAASHRLTVSALQDEKGATVIPERQITYSSLCIAVGSTSNYFGVPGAVEHTISLNVTEDAEHFRLKMLQLLANADYRRETDPKAGVDIVIIGGGATGVELAAELREASKAYTVYGFRQLDPVEDVRITLLEGSPRILAPLPERVSIEAKKLLTQRQITVVEACRVVEIQPHCVVDKESVQRPADLCVWAAGIKAPDFLATLGLPVNKGGQIEVTRYLHVNDHPNIYALGDCAACLGDDGKLLPPRAQTAHQQAQYLYKFFVSQASGRASSSKPFVYKDNGSLVSIGQHKAVGNLIGSLGLGWFVEGFFARLMYMSLHLMHSQAVLGTLRTGVLALGRFLVKRTSAQVKLR